MFKTGKQFTLAHNIVNGHKPCCAKALRKLVSVSCSEEIFSCSRWIMEDLVGAFEGFFHSPTSTFSSSLKSIMYCVKTTWTNVNWCCSFSDHSAWVIFKSFMCTLGLSIPTWINLFASKTFNDSLKCFIRLFEVPWPRNCESRYLI